MSRLTPAGVHPKQITEKDVGEGKGAREKAEAQTCNTVPAKETLP